MKRLLILVATILASHPVRADCSGASGPFRKCFDNSNAPAALVYRLFVRQLFADSLENEEDRIGWHDVEAGLTPNMSSDDVISYFVSKYLEIENEVEEAQKRTLCIDEKPRYNGAENFSIFNQMEEVSLNIYEKHLFFARSDLSASGLFDLDKALDEYPGSFADMFMDHEKATNGSIRRISEAAAALCGKPWGHQFSSSRSLREN